MRKFAALLICVLSSALTFAQFTTVSGTVIDPNGLPYANGTIAPKLVISGSPTLGGLAYTPPTQPVGLNTAGKFIMQLADNTQLLPGGSQWTFQTCSAAGTIQPAGGKGPVCFSITLTISGASQDISAQLQAAALALALPSGGGIPGVAPGSVLTSQGVSAPPIYQTKLMFDVRDFGVIGNGSTDDTTALQNAINAVCKSGTAVSGTLNVPATLKMKITSTITFGNCWGIYFNGTQATGEANGALGSGAQIIWAGAAGGTVMLINQTRDSTFENFSILTQSASGQNNANIGIDIDEVGTVTSITTNNVFHNIAIRSHDSNANLALIRMGKNAPANVEDQIFDHLTLNCSDNIPTVNNNGFGVFLTGSPGTAQMNRLKFHSIDISLCSVAYNLQPGGSADIIDIDLGDFNRNYTDLQTGPSDTHVTYRNIRSEVCTNPIVIAAGNSGPLWLDNLSFSGCTGTLFTIPANSSRTIRMTAVRSDNVPTAFSVSTSNNTCSIYADDNVWPSGFAVDLTFFPTHFPNGWESSRNFSFGSFWPPQRNGVPAIYEAGANPIAIEKIYTNTQALTTGAATHTFGNSFSYTSSATFGCTCTDRTAANACSAVPASATTVTLAGTGADVLWLSCSGH